MKSYIKAIYRIEKSKTKEHLDIVDIGNKIAQEQTLGGYKWRFDKKFDKEEYSAEVSDYFGNKIRIRYPVENIDSEIPSLLNYVAGDLFGSKYVSKTKLIDLELPSGYIKDYKGPQFGVEGIREMINLREERPLAGMIIKPSLGLNIDEIKEIAKWGFEAGIDIIKEDEKFINPDYCNWESRVNEIIEFLKNVNSGNSKKLLYVLNVSEREDEIIDYLRNRELSDEVTLGLMTTPITTGFNSVTKLSTSEIDLPVYVHRTGHAALTRTDHGISMKVLAKIFRLAGGDFIHVGSFSGSHEREREYVISNKNELNKKYDGWGEIRSPIPVISGGINPLNIEENIQKTHKEKFNIDDNLFMVGSGIYAYPGNREKAIKGGVKAVIEAIKAFKSNFSVSEIISKRGSNFEHMRNWIRENKNSSKR
ncbi:hypothetical protein AKJ51_03025 [candidate division MSBL1 archaeon SCGC-AAA382A20]|uniref:Ribulose 1,5-bisphosphate carboxylase n=1 Tax=candidate division MSBL1 archaeon SCGC-AAA382A20 TaxID=1698280 RepID=A0A133VJV9_9EURY|nr:hypothetical protein AKJ51_03025 [candidate division MSBL1 archaeon SCGC-AAA382A20]